MRAAYLRSEIGPELMRPDPPIFGDFPTFRSLMNPSAPAIDLPHCDQRRLPQCASVVRWFLSHRCWVLVVWLLQILLLSGRCAEQGMTGVPDQLAPLNGAIGPLAYSHSPYWMPQSVEISSSNPALVPISNVVVNMDQRTVAVQLVAGQRGRSVISVTIQAMNTLYILPEFGFFSFVVETPMEVSQEGGTASSSNLATRGTAFAKDVGIPGFSIPHLNDGVYGNASSWAGNSANSFAGISFGSKQVPINQVAFGRDNTGAVSDRVSGTVTLEYTTTPYPNALTGTWIRIGAVKPAWLTSPALRHVIDFPTVMATGFRLVTEVNGAAIDEIELYQVTTGPMVVAPDHQKIPLHASTAALPFATSAEPLTITATSSNQAFIPNANITIGGPAGNRTVQLNPVFNGHGSTVITLSVSDGVQTASDSFTVATIPPAVTAPPDQVIPLYAGATTLPFAASSEPGLVITATSSNQSFIPDASVILSGTPGNRSVEFTPVTDESGTAVITLTVSDGVQTTSDQFTVSTLLNLLEEGGGFWSGNLAEGRTPFAKDVLPGYASHTIPHLTDGIYGNNSSWIGNSANSFAGVSLGANPLPINCVAFGRDNTGNFGDRAIDRYTIQFTTVPNPDSNTPESSWHGIGVVETARFDQPARRHLISFTEVNATGLRIVNASGGACIDEMEIYHVMPAIVAPGDVSLFQSPLQTPTTGALTYRISQETGLIVSASSSNQALVPNGNIVLAGSGSNRTVTVTAAPNQAGSALITLTASNGTQGTSDGFTFTVVPQVIYPVADHAGLVSAILSANGSAAFPVIQLTGNITLGDSLPWLTRATVVEGGGFTIHGAGRNAFVIGDAGAGTWTPDVTIKNLTIQGARAAGGNAMSGLSAAGGGGGGGFGGAVFVSRGATVRLQNVSLASNQAQGGSSCIGQALEDRRSHGTPGGNGIGASGLGNGAAGQPYDYLQGGAAGIGFGGGGGGAANIAMSGGDGGYGGGGGGTGNYTAFQVGYAASGGFAGGMGGYYDGGGGAGLGGGIFIQTGGTLLLTGSLGVNGNSVAGGSAGPGWGMGATPGSAFGNGIFAHETNTIQFAPDGAATVQTVADGIADEVGSGGGGVGAGGRLSVLKKGAGTTLLSGANTFAGVATIEEGRLLLTGSNSSAVANQSIFGAYGVAFTHAYTQAATGIFQVRLGATSDRLDAASVSLNGGLDIVLGAGAPATPITIINNTGSAPVSGTFAGLPEGATFVNNGNVFRISYTSGTGNDVALTLTPPFLDIVEGGSATTSNLATRGIAFAKDLLPGFPADHTVPHLNDGIYGNPNSWIGNSTNSFAGISFGTRPIPINQIAFGRDNLGVHTTRAASHYTIQYTTAPNPGAGTPEGNWITIGTIDTATLPNPSLRHVFSFPTLMATGIRIITAVNGTAIDEIEVYHITNGLMVVAPDHQTLNVSSSSTAPLPFTTSADSNLTFSVSSDNPTLIQNGNMVLGGTAGNRTVTLTPVAGLAGSAKITITISNGVESAADSFILTVPTAVPTMGLIGNGLGLEANSNTAGFLNLALATNGSTAFAKDVFPIALHQITHLNDGLHGNASSWIGNSLSSFAGINLGGLKKINRVAFGRDATGVLADQRWNGIYTIQYTTAANPDANTASWTTIGAVDLGYPAIFPPPSILRHLISFPPVMATGLRILTETASGSPHALGIDELEIYHVSGPDLLVEQFVGRPVQPAFGAVTFGSVAQMSAVQTQITITNPGSEDLSLGAFTIGGVNATDFSVSTLASNVLTAGSSMTVSVMFAPGGLGVRNATLSIASNASGMKSNFVLNLSGTGVAITSPAGGLSSGLTLVETGGTFGVGNLASAASGGSAFAKDVLPGNASHAIAHLNDGVYGNANSWINNSAYSFAGIHLGGLKRFDRIAFGRNNTNPQLVTDRATGLYSLQYTTAASPDASTTHWTAIGTVDLSHVPVFGTEASGGPALRHLFSFTPVLATGFRIVTVGSGLCIDEIEIYPHFTPQENWRQTHFNTMANTGQAADTVDANHDGEMNLLEFATGQNPHAISRAGLGVSRDVSALNVTYTRSRAAMDSGVTFMVETSDTLEPNSWTTTGVSAPEVLSDDGANQQVRVSIPTTTQRRFVRLRVTD